MSFRTVLIVQARMGSSRLPGKVLLEVLGKTLLEYQIERLRLSREIDQIIIATTILKMDDPIVSLCKELGVAYFRGSSDDVLSRYYEAGKISGADIVVRCNSDCPLIDAKVVDRVIRVFKDEAPLYDYVSNILRPTYPTGMHTEAFSINALEAAFEHAHQAEEREHVTPYIYRNPQAFNLLNIAIDRDLSKIRLTIDYPEDFQVVTKIIEGLYPANPKFDMDDMLKFIDLNPEILAINSQFTKKATV